MWLTSREIEPWQPSYKHELATAIALGSAAEEKLKYTLPARFGSLGVIFEDADKARLLTYATAFSNTIWRQANKQDWRVKLPPTSILFITRQRIWNTLI